MNNRLKIVVIGGGTGTFTVLSALKPYTHDLTAIVSMADDGGSTGVLRDELGVLPPGDVRQCLVALSESPKIRDLFSYRFEEGTFSGHSFGNLFLTALEKMTGNFAEAIETASEILRVDGRVLPATLDNVRLKMSWDDETIVLNGERVIDAEHFANDPRKARLSLEPTANANPAALEAITSADLVIIAPGDLYTSIGPLLVIDGFGEALQQTAAKVVYVCNLVTKKGQTEGFSVATHANEVERFVDRQILDYVVYNNAEPMTELAEKYREEDAFVVTTNEDELSSAHYEVVAGDFLGQVASKEAADKLPVTRSLIRHDETKLGKVLTSLVTEE